MNYSRHMEATFGAGKAGLTSVQFQLIDADGTLNGAAVMLGILEIGTSTGFYGLTVVFPDALQA